MTTKHQQEKFECKVEVIRHLEVADQEVTITALGEDGWELISVDNGIAYFSRYLDRK